MELKFLIFCMIFHLIQIVCGQQSTKRVVCFYDATTGKYEGEPHYFSEKFLPKALPKCTHLIYSFAEIAPKNFKIRNLLLKPKPSELKTQFPHLKIFLSVGGDKPEFSKQYLQFLEAGEFVHTYFAKYVRGILRYLNFDGLDLAFPLPPTKPHTVRSGVETFIGMFSNEEGIDEKSILHKQQYTQLVNILHHKFAKANLQLSMTVLPNINSSLYFDIFKIHRTFEFINIFAFDFVTPFRNPTEADYSAPIYFKNGDNRLLYNNIDFQVDNWIHNGCPGNKLNLGIATYGRAWRLTIDSGLKGLPVVERAQGLADPGKYSKEPGLLSLTEICVKLETKGMLRKVIDKDHKYGNYAFNPADRNNKNGIWISYDDPDFAGIETVYVLEKSLGGIAVYNLQNDDFYRFCRGQEFPILSRISKGLGR